MGINRNTINVELLAATKEDLAGWVGRKVYKPSGKKFKSGLTYNTVKAVVDHPVMPNLPAFTFHEDDSVVEARRCMLANLGTIKLALMSLYGSFKRPYKFIRVRNK